MNWCCFKFWLLWRFLMAFLAHFNWFAAIYVNCVYFTLWKSYDLLLFWMHLFLCICFKPLRSENRLLVVCNLFLSKRKYPNRSYQQLYYSLYNQRFTKSERALRNLDILEENQSDDENNEEDMMGNPVEEDKSFIPKNTTQLYPDLPETEMPMPNIIVDRKAATKLPRRDSESEDLLKFKDPKSDDQNNSGEKESVKHFSRFIPNFMQRSLSKETNSSDLNERAMLEQENKRLKEGKQLEKLKQKELLKRRREELRVLARIERRRKNLSSAIDLLLTWLRLITTFAILVGNIHKTFLPKYLRSFEQDVYQNPDLLMMFTITMSLDILLFWFMMFWTYCQQCRLCCQLGLCRFFVWLFMLGFFGGMCMYFPMHLAHEQLDMEWCSFSPGTPINTFFEDLNNFLNT